MTGVYTYNMIDESYDMLASIENSDFDIIPITMVFQSITPKSCLYMFQGCLDLEEKISTCCLQMEGYCMCSLLKMNCKQGTVSTLLTYTVGLGIPPLAPHVNNNN